MSAPNTHTLTLLLEREIAERDAALLALEQARERLAQAKGQAEGLTGYRQEYIQRWNAEFARQGTVEILLCYRSFMERLDQAIGQQTQVVTRLESAVDQARARLVAAEQKAAAVRKLIERRHQEYARQESRRDQKLADEAAQRATWAARLAGGMDLSPIT